jgi:acetyl-CoA acetyltransferase
MELSLSRKAAIVGIGSTDFSKNSGRSELVLALQASLAAIEDAGLKPEDIDGITRFALDSNTEASLVRSLGLNHLSFHSQVGYGGNSTCAIIAHAAAAVVAGLADYVLCFRALNDRSGMRFGQGDRYLIRDGQVGYASADRVPGGFLAAPFGLLAPGQVIAMWARRYMYEYGLSLGEMSLILGSIAVTQRAYAQNNPAAMMRGKPLSMEDYLNGRMIADPLRIYDHCLETDGACALIVTSADRAKDLKRMPVYILAATQFLSPDSEPIQAFTDNLTRLVPDDAVQELFGQAGITPEDVDVAGIYDATTISVVLTLEDFGFCGRGESGEFLTSGQNKINGRLPTNTHGGLLSEGYINGVNTVVEAVRQIRGTSYNQVPNAEIAFVSSYGASSLILGR